MAVSEMKWRPDAEDLLRRVPFFVRNKVRARVEAEVRKAGRKEVSSDDVHDSRKRFLRRMSSEVRGYQLDTCFSAGDCPNRTLPMDSLRKRLEKVLREADLLRFLKKSVSGDLKFHHDFRVSLAECPNACSQPQIKDIGIIGAIRPGLTDNPCNHCRACVEACPDAAVILDDKMERPGFDLTRCQKCGRCISACSADVLNVACQGFRILLGGKLGRHPRLARELPGIFDENAVIAVVRKCLDLYKQDSRNGQRFAQILTDEKFQRLADWSGTLSGRNL